MWWRPINNKPNTDKTFQKETNFIHHLAGSWLSVGSGWCPACYASRCTRSVTCECDTRCARGSSRSPDRSARSCRRRDSRRGWPRRWSACRQRSRRQGRRLREARTHSICTYSLRWLRASTRKPQAGVLVVMESDDDRSDGQEKGWTCAVLTCIAKSWTCACRCTCNV